MALSIVSTRRVIVAAVAILALVGFAALVVDVLYESLHQAAPHFGSMKVFWVNSLAGLVGGVVATGFGQAPPSQVVSGNLAQRNAVGVGALVAPPELQPTPSSGTVPTPARRGASQAPQTTAQKTQQVIGLIYALVYIVLGICSIGVVIVIENKGDAPDLVKSLATVSGGLILAIIGAFFAGNQP